MIWIAATALMLAGAVGYLRRRLAARRGRSVPALSDEDVRRIVEQGRLVTEEDEPLDLEEIREEEERFWEESWEEPEERW